MGALIYLAKYVQRFCDKEIGYNCHWKLLRTVFFVKINDENSSKGIIY